MSKQGRDKPVPVCVDGFSYDSEDNSGWKGPQEMLQAMSAVRSDHITQGAVQSDFEYTQAWT